MSPAKGILLPLTTLITISGAKFVHKFNQISMSCGKSSLLWFLVVHFIVIRCQLPHLQPGDLAPSFALQTLNGMIVYRKSNASSKTPTHPVILQLFTRRSAFLEALWSNKTSLENFIELSPGNTHYVFMSTSDSKAVEDVLWMRSQLYRAIDNYHRRCVKFWNFLGLVLETVCSLELLFLVEVYVHGLASRIH